MKYFSHKVTYKGDTFDSRKEMNRYIELDYLQRQGKIKDLRRQVRFEILPRLDKLEIKHLKTKDKMVVRCEERAKYYTADFTYFDVGRNKTYIEDVKSIATASVRDYPLRRHLIKMLIDKHNDEGGSQWAFREVT